MRNVSERLPVLNGGFTLSMRREPGPHSLTKCLLFKGDAAPGTVRGKRQMQRAPARRPRPRTSDHHNFVAEAVSTNSTAYTPD